MFYTNQCDYLSLMLEFEAQVRVGMTLTLSKS